MIVLYQNALKSAAIVPEAGEPLLDDDTTTRWMPDDGDSVAFEALPFVQITHVGIAAHNLGSVSGSLLVEAYDGASWAALTTIAPANDDAILLPVTPTAATGIRITATGTGIRLAVFYAGEPLEFERRIYQGHTPIAFSKQNVLVVKSQGGGQYLGNRIKRRGASTTYSVKHLTPQFVRRKLEGFRQHYNGGGRFFISWRPDKYLEDAAYGYGDGNMSPTNTGPAAFMAVDFSVVSYEQTPWGDS